MSIITHYTTDGHGGRREGAGRPRKGEREQLTVYLTPSNMRRLEAISNGKKSVKASELLNCELKKHVSNLIVSRLIVLFFPVDSTVRIANKQIQNNHRNINYNALKGSVNFDAEQTSFYTNCLVFFPAELLEEAAQHVEDGFIKLPDLDRWRERWADYMERNGWDPMTITTQKAKKIWNCKTL